MANQFGFDSYAAVGVETTYDTVVPRIVFQEFKGESGGHDPAQKEIPSWRDRTVKGFFQAGIKSSKSMEHTLLFEGFLEHLRSAMWGYAHSELEVGVRQEHTFSIGTTVPASLTLEHSATPANGQIYSGAFLRTLRLSFPADADPTLGYDFVASGEQQLTKTAGPVFADPTVLMVKPEQITAEIDDNVDKEYDAFSVQIVSGIDEGRPKIGTGDAKIAKPQPTGRHVITGELSRDYDDNITQAALVSGSTVKLELFCTGPALGGGTYTFNILVPKAKILGDPLVRQGPGIVTERVRWQAQFDATDSAIKITTVNGEAQLQ